MTKEPKYQKFITRTEQSEYAWEVAASNPGLIIRSGATESVEPGESVEAKWTSLGNGRQLIRIDGRPIVARIVRLSASEYQIESGGHRAIIRSEDEISARASREHHGANAGQTGPIAVPAPMPGTVVKVLVTDGDTVTEGQPILIIEAMKMQNELAAPGSGTVQGLRVQPGQAVEARQKLCEILRESSETAEPDEGTALDPPVPSQTTGR